MSPEYIEMASKKIRGIILKNHLPVTEETIDAIIEGCEAGFADCNKIITNAVKKTTTEMRKWRKMLK